MLNVSLLVGSFKHVTSNFDLITSVATWIYQELLRSQKQYSKINSKLNTALDREDYDIVETLVTGFRQSRNIINDHLRHSYRREYKDLYTRIKLLIQAGANIKAVGNSIINKACELDHIDVV